LPQRCDRIFRGCEIVRETSLEVQVGDGSGDRAVLQLLGVIEFVSPGYACRVEMADVLDVVPNGGVAKP
jgi:hypothetical protein